MSLRAAHGHTGVAVAPDKGNASGSFCSGKPQTVCAREAGAPLHICTTTTLIPPASEARNPYNVKHRHFPGRHYMHGGK